MAEDLIIDGYNLLHATDIFGRGVGPGSLERSRRALLGVLAASLGPEQCARTTVVFDAGRGGRGLPRKSDHGGIRVLYAAQHENADALIEQLICTSSAPRNLTVVSSDHRVQRAARRRRAKPVDSDQWYSRLLAHRRHRQSAPPPEASKPEDGPSEAEVEHWLAEFGGQEAGEQNDARSSDLDHPFPPGYAEDLLDDAEAPEDEDRLST